MVPLLPLGWRSYAEIGQPISSGDAAQTIRFHRDTLNLMIPEPYELFDIEKGADKVFLIGSAWIVLFLFLL